MRISQLVFGVSSGGPDVLQCSEALYVVVNFCWRTQLLAHSARATEVRNHPLWSQPITASSDPPTHPPCPPPPRSLAIPDPCANPSARRVCACDARAVKFAGPCRGHGAPTCAEGQSRRTGPTCDSMGRCGFMVRCGFTGRCGFMGRCGPAGRSTRSSTHSTRSAASTRTRPGSAGTTGTPSSSR